MKFDDFDIKRNQLTNDLSVNWYQNGEIIKTIEIESHELISKHPICRTCLFYRGEIIHMDERITETIRGENYTAYQCRTCKTINNGIPCTCGEIPHRIQCPVGFNNYFKNNTL